MTIASPMTLTPMQCHKCVSNVTRLIFNLQYLGHYLSYYIQTWHDGRLRHGVYYAYARVYYLDFDTRAQWVGTGTSKNQR